MNAVSSWTEFVYHVICKSIIKREQIVQVLFTIFILLRTKEQQNFSAPSKQEQQG